MTPEEFVTTLRRHQRFTSGNGGARADLSHQDLSGLRLPNIDLQRANLAGADFSCCVLTGVNFTRADMFGANFNGSDSSGANFEEADLRGTRFRNAKLERTNLRAADLRLGTLMDMSRPGKAKSGADGKRAKAAAGLTDVDMHNAAAAEAKLREGSMASSDLRGASLIGANLEEARLDKANLAGANLEGARLHKTRLTGANLRGALLAGAATDDVGFRVIGIAPEGAITAEAPEVFGQQPQRHAFVENRFAVILRIDAGEVAGKIDTGQNIEGRRRVTDGGNRIQGRENKAHEFFAPVDRRRGRIALGRSDAPGVRKDRLHDFGRQARAKIHGLLRHHRWHGPNDRDKGGRGPPNPAAKKHCPSAAVNNHVWSISCGAAPRDPRHRHRLASLPAGGNRAKVGGPPAAASHRAGRFLSLGASMPLTAQHTIHSTHGHLGWDNSFPPVMTVAPGDVVEFEAMDASCGQLTPASVAADVASLDFGRINPVTGPVFIDGAEPGDALKVTIGGVAPADWGWTANIPGFGLLADDFPEPALHIWSFDTSCKVPASYGPAGRVPLKPFCGTIGVAPAAPGLHSIVPPRNVGGNMDARDLSEGCELYLPVEAAGALFSVGDGHATQGDGEVCGTALETPVSVVLKFDLIKRANLAFPRYTAPGPVSRHFDAKGYEVTTGIGPDLMEAARAAVRQMVDLIASRHAITAQDAYMLCSVCADLRISSIVDQPNWVVSFYFPRIVFD
jgi:acetamidase/formamidase/uncharacterized protein YjbI with pentapeptide repeats